MKTHSISILTIAISLASCAPKEGTEPPVEESTASTYPLTTCVVSGKKLGSMGDPVLVEHEGTTVKLCCEHCIDKFNSDPAKYTKLVTDAK